MQEEIKSNNLELVKISSILIIAVLLMFLGYRGYWIDKMSDKENEIKILNLTNTYSIEEIGSFLFDFVYDEGNYDLFKGHKIERTYFRISNESSLTSFTCSDSFPNNISAVRGYQNRPVVNCGLSRVDNYGVLIGECKCYYLKI
ncbi:MAG: hypothetical protein AABX35_02380 [Nanoarchaeota archaeon]